MCLRHYISSRGSDLHLHPALLRFLHFLEVLGLRGGMWRGPRVALQHGFHTCQEAFHPARFRILFTRGAQVTQESAV